MATAKTTLPAAGRRKATERVFERENRHSRNVRRLKFLLPAAALLMTAALIGQSVISMIPDGSVDISGVTIEGGRLVMVNPTLAGVNGQARPYEMKAARALQDLSDGDVVYLEEIDARLPVGVGEWADIEAARGTMHKDSNLLEVTSPAVIRTTDGMVARLRSATLDMGSGDLASEDAVEIDLDGSRVSADSLLVTEGGNVMVFEREVKVVIEGRRIRTASAQPGERDAGH